MNHAVQPGFRRHLDHAFARLRQRLDASTRSRLLVRRTRLDLEPVPARSWLLLAEGRPALHAGRRRL
jgi:hypothetical protein